jgi:hypothetical protein
MAVPTVAFTSLSSTIRALAAADQPLLFGENWMRDLATAPQWKQGGSWAAGADETAATGPTSYAYDDWDHQRTYPATAQTVWYFLIDFGASGAGPFDTMAILNPANLTSVQVDAQVADNNAYSTNLRTIATVTPTTGARIILLDLDHGVGVEQQYSDTRFMRIKFSGAAHIPRFGELIVSRRRQLKTSAVGTYDPKPLSSKVAVFESDSGVDVAYTFHKNRRRVQGAWSMHEDAYVSDWESLFETDTDGGTLPFVWIEKPGTASSTALWMRLNTFEMTGPLEGWTERLMSLDAIEKGPNFLSLGV